MPSQENQNTNAAEPTTPSPDELIQIDRYIEQYKLPPMESKYRECTEAEMWQHLRKVSQVIALVEDKYPEAQTVVQMYVDALLPLTSIDCVVWEWPTPLRIVDALEYEMNLDPQNMNHVRKVLHEAGAWLELKDIVPHILEKLGGEHKGHYLPPNGVVYQTEAHWFSVRTPAKLLQVLCYGEGTCGGPFWNLTIPPYKERRGDTTWSWLQPMLDVLLADPPDFDDYFDNDFCDFED